MDAQDLKRERQRKGISVLEVAEALGLEPPTVVAVENDELRAMPEMLALWEDVILRLPDRRGWLVRLAARCLGGRRARVII